MANNVNANEKKNGNNIDELCAIENKNEGKSGFLFVLKNVIDVSGFECLERYI